MGPTLFFKATLKPEGSKMLFSRLACLYLSQDLGERAPACLRIWIGLYCHTSPCGRLLIDTRELITQRRRRRRREQQKSNRFRLAKQQLCTRIALFLYISSPSLHDDNMKLPNFTFCRGRERRQRLSFSFPELWYVFKNATPEKCANIWRIERVRISAIKFELARIHFLSDVFVDVGRRCCLSSLLINLIIIIIIIINFI